MYYYIKGILVAKGINYIVVDAAGVGYMINTPSSDIEKAPPQGSEIIMYTYLNVREDAMELYGFITEEEKTLFLQLISVSGVGPKAALSILSSASPQRIMTAIIAGETSVLTKAQGVGPKAANRIILELKDKIDNKLLGIDGNEGILEETKEFVTDSRAEALSALTVLGYNQNEAKNVILKIEATLSTEEIIKKALAQLM